MRKHNGMRPQDILILLRIATWGFNDWLIKDLANDLFISQSEISESLHRSYVAGFLTREKKEVYGEHLLEFLIHGIKYVFPHHPGPGTRGMPTAGSALPIKKNYKPIIVHVWKDPKSRQLGQAVEPLYPSVPEVCRNDKRLYELLALVDAMRVGTLRGKGLVEYELKKRIIF